MTDSALQPFDKQEYLNIETYRKNGDAVCTPVWFVQDGGALFVRTGADSGKVKRIKRDGRVRVAPCDMRGALKGEWVAARAGLASDDESRRAAELIRRKYKLAATFFGISSRLRGMQECVIKITPMMDELA